MPVESTWHPITSLCNSYSGYCWHIICVLNPESTGWWQSARWWNKPERFFVFVFVFPGLDECLPAISVALVRIARDLEFEKWSCWHVWPKDHPITHRPGINSKKFFFSFLKVFFTQIWFCEMNWALLHVEKVKTNKCKHVTKCFGEMFNRLFYFLKSWLWREAENKLKSKSKYSVSDQKRNIYLEKYLNLQVRNMIAHQGYSKWGL